MDPFRYFIMFQTCSSLCYNSLVFIFLIQTSSTYSTELIQLIWFSTLPTHFPLEEPQWTCHFYLFWGIQLPFSISYKSTFIWDPKWTQTGLKCRSVYMVIYMRFHCGNFPNYSKTMHMCKWYLLINANLINVKQMLRYWLFF